MSPITSRLARAIRGREAALAQVRSIAAAPPRANSRPARLQFDQPPTRFPAMLRLSTYRSSKEEAGLEEV